MKVIIPREYIIDGDGKDVGIEPKEIKIIRRESPYTNIYYGKTDKNFHEANIIVDLQVFEVCALIADAMRKNTETIILTEKDG